MATRIHNVPGAVVATLPFLMRKKAPFKLSGNTLSYPLVLFQHSSIYNSNRPCQTAVQNCFPGSLLRIRGLSNQFFPLASLGASMLLRCLSRYRGLVYTHSPIGLLNAELACLHIYLHTVHAGISREIATDHGRAVSPLVRTRLVTWA